MNSDLLDNIIKNLQNIDINYYNIGWVTYNIVFISYKLRKYNPNYQLKKEFKIKAATEVKIPPEILDIPDSIDIEKLYKLVLGERICNFVNVMESKLPEKSKESMKKNLSFLQVEERDVSEKKFLKKEKCLAYYKPKDNIIVLAKGSNEVSIDHELMHLSTTKYDGENVFAGFNQRFKKNNQNIAYALNEGYTQYITEKYFDFDEDEVRGMYCLEKSVAACVETIVGEEEMEALFFNSDLPGLIESLAKYSSYDEVYYFIRELDIFSKYQNKKFLSKSSSTKLIKIFMHLHVFLTDSAVKKNLTKKIRNEELDNSEILNNKIKEK